MDKKQNGLIAGIDLTKDSVQVSCLNFDMEEPQTLTTKMGEQQYEIPLCLFKRAQEDVWYYGDKARTNIYSNHGIFVGDLWEGACSHQEIVLEDEEYTYERLMSIYMEKILRLVYRNGFSQGIDALVIAMEQMDTDRIEMLKRIMGGLSIVPGKLYFIDYKESFSAFVTSGKRELWSHEVFLFHYAGRHLRAYQLKVNQKMLPFQVRADVFDYGEVEYNKEELEESAQAREDMDKRFLATLQEAFSRRIVSTAYLIGDGFEPGWMKDSLRMVCRNRRVFQGNNLFTKGACHAGALYLGWRKPVGSYASGQVLNCDIRIPIRNRGAQEYLYAAHAGEPWYLAKLDIECMLEDAHAVEIEVLPDRTQVQKNPHTERLELLEFPMRAGRSSRVHIQVDFKHVNEARILVEDLGIGEFYPATGQVWSKEFSLLEKEEGR